ncbi:DUF262 domain-containing protein [Salmonella enterica subsp. houtenae]|nr:DUF262 domain-containing protein [Salmonella enterica subsp. houtenae]ECZ5453566.1 DUF262 domain-containing protein [Salmonella enterica subsp. houtenae]EDN2202650.1 hypothetical protein [Salmonella enterica]EDV1457089.1 DUF262 domain-containing protein [Salmonella enterica subsp. houtenae]EDW3820232.1 DUF262 domain-containing protein [Salmonella enterica subsp. houtenae]
MIIDAKTFSILAIFQMYNEGKLKVNRKYQRKLVWTMEEKEALVDSIKNGYPIPLILLADVDGHYEIIDGLQRLNAIISYIENQFGSKGKYFNIESFPLANQLAKSGEIISHKNEREIDDVSSSVNFTSYQIPVTIIPKASESEITEVFGRINSYGRQLSDQEKRQAGIITSFSQLVRKLAIEIRGDVSEDIVDLKKTPEISTTNKREPNKKYSVVAENVFWVKQGILNAKGLRDSYDEELLADIAISILLKEPFKYSKENLDEVYELNSSRQLEVEQKLTSYGVDILSLEIKRVWSTIESVLDENNGVSLKDIVRVKKGMPAIRQPFYYIFMAFYKLIITENKVVSDAKELLKSLNGCDANISTQRHHADVIERNKNINIIYGLISDYFIASSNPSLQHGRELTLEIRNILIRSDGGESKSYELKQGLYSLDKGRALNSELLSETIPKSLCGIANANHGEKEGYFLIGVAENEATAKRVQSLDNVISKEVQGLHVVGIDRELNLNSESIDSYMKRIISAIEKAALPKDFQAKIISNMEHVKFFDKTIIIIKIPKLSSPVLYNGGEFYLRKDSNTSLITDISQILAIGALFKN